MNCSEIRWISVSRQSFFCDYCGLRALKSKSAAPCLKRPYPLIWEFFLNDRTMRNLYKWLMFHEDDKKWGSQNVNKGPTGISLTEICYRSIKLKTKNAQLSCWHAFSRELVKHCPYFKHMDFVSQNIRLPHSIRSSMHQLQCLEKYKSNLGHKKSSFLLIHLFKFE